MLNVENFAGVAYRIVALIAFLCRLASLATPLGWGARQGQGRRHEVLVGEGGWIHRHTNPPTPTI